MGSGLLQACFWPTLTVADRLAPSVVGRPEPAAVDQGSFMTPEPAAAAYLALAVLTTVLVVGDTRANLGRLIAGTEPKAGQKSRQMIQPDNSAFGPGPWLAVRRPPDRPSYQGGTQPPWPSGA